MNRHLLKQAVKTKELRAKLMPEVKEQWETIAAMERKNILDEQINKRLELKGKLFSMAKHGMSEELKDAVIRLSRSTMNALEMMQKFRRGDPEYQLEVTKQGGLFLVY